jgi:hypothetical protein
MIEIDFSKCVDPIFFFSNTYASAYILYKAARHYGSNIEVYYPISTTDTLNKRLNQVEKISEALNISVKPVMLPLQVFNYTNRETGLNLVFKKTRQAIDQFVNYELSLDSSIFNQAELDIIIEQSTGSNVKVISFLALIYKAGWTDSSCNILPLEQFPQRTVVFTANQSREVLLRDVMFNRIYEKNNDRLLNNTQSAYFPFFTPLIQFNDVELFESAKEDEELLKTMVLVQKCLAIDNALCGDCDECIFRRKTLFDLEIPDPTKYVFI